MFNMFFSRRAANDPPEEAANSRVTTKDIRPSDPLGRKPTVAELIDAEFAERDARKADATLFDPGRILQFRPDISPDDKDWKDFRTLMIKQMATNSLKDILQEHFEEGQRLSIIPPMLPIEPGVILDIQERNGKYYKNLLGEGGRFSGQPDNLVTKLTMLKFGFPVSGLTMQNLLRMGKAPGEDDPPDEPIDIPENQMVRNLEQPLEFLNVYQERSHGWKTLRRRVASQGLGNSLKNPKYQNPIQPVGFVGGLRGGAGTGADEADTTDHGFIYSHRSGRVRVTSDVASFVEKSLQILRIDPKSDWEFLVELYDNRNDNKNRASNPRWKIGYAAANKITKKDQSAWEKFLQPLVIDEARDWMVAVRRVSSDEAPSNLHAAVVDQLGLEPVIPEDNGSTEFTAKVSSERHQHIVQAYVYKELVSLEDSHSFLYDVMQRLGLSLDQFEFAVDFYSRRPGETDLEIKDTLIVNNKSPRNLFDKKIVPKKNDISKDWFFVARRVTDTPDANFLPVRKPTTGILYGYGGQLFAEDTLESIFATAQQLLRFEPNSDWSFSLDVHGDVINTYKVNRKNLMSIFKTVIEPILMEGDDWPLLVRHDNNPKSSTINPRDSIDVIYLNYAGRGIAYWKVPKDLTQKYGINQTQESFFAAMQILFPAGYVRPRQNIFVEGIDIGFAGMEVTTKLWERVRDDTAHVLQEASGNPNAMRCFQYEVTLHNLVPHVKDVIGVRLIGSHHFGHADANRISEILSEVIEMRQMLAFRKNPSQFRIWKAAEDREAHEKGTLLKYGRGEAEVKALKDWFHSEKGSTNCVYFRPEWSTFKLSKEGESTGDTKAWDAESNSTLASFRAAVGKLFGKSINLSKNSILIFEAEPFRRFNVTTDTSEEEWSRHVYDWFNTSKLEIRISERTQYTLDTSTPWGLPGGANTKPDTPGNNTGASRKVGTGMDWEATTPGALFGNGIKFNRDRANVSHTVGKKVAKGWNEFTERQHVLDKMQHDTYLQPQSVFERGRRPDAPLFSESKELAIAVGANTPTVYGQLHTPTDVQHLKNRERKLLNQVLERMVNCNICDVSFKAFENEEIISHYAHHQQEIASAGDCVLCGDKNWKFWSAEEKRDHLHYHQARDEGAVAKQFWAGFQCPGCDQDLSKLNDKDQILSHVISHDPLTVKFCDRCAKPFRHCTAEEIAHHHRTCIGEVGNEANDLDPAFCRYCGVDTNFETKKQGDDHQRGCGSRLTKLDRFCVTCGFETARLDVGQKTRHKADCKSPGGAPRTYCKRCGINVADLTGDDISRHANSCKSSVYTEPAILASVNQRLKEINAQMSTSQEKEAKRVKQLAEIRESQRALDADRALFQKEIAALKSGGSLTAESRALLSQLGKGRETAVHQSVASFNCPFVSTTKDGRQVVCGELLSIVNGGANVSAHYSAHYFHLGNAPRTVWEPREPGPNAAKYRRMREDLERQTAEFDQFVKNLMAGGYLPGKISPKPEKPPKRSKPEVTVVVKEGVPAPPRKGKKRKPEEPLEELQDEEEEEEEENSQGSGSSYHASSDNEESDELDEDVDASNEESPDPLNQTETASKPSAASGNLNTEKPKKKGTKGYKGAKVSDTAYKQPKNPDATPSPAGSVRSGLEKEVEELVSTLPAKPVKTKPQAKNQTGKKRPAKKQRTAK